MRNLSQSPLDRNHLFPDFSTWRLELPLLLDLVILQGTPLPPSEAARPRGRRRRNNGAG